MVLGDVDVLDCNIPSPVEPRQRYRGNSRVELGDVSVLRGNNRIISNHIGVIGGNSRVELGDVSALEVTTESFRATSAF